MSALLLLQLILHQFFKPVCNPGLCGHLYLQFWMCLQTFPSVLLIIEIYFSMAIPLWSSKHILFNSKNEPKSQKRVL